MELSRPPSNVDAAGRKDLPSCGASRQPACSHVAPLEDVWQARLLRLLLCLLQRWRLWLRRHFCTCLPAATAYTPIGRQSACIARQLSAGLALLFLFLFLLRTPRDGLRQRSQPRLQRVVPAVHAGFDASGDREAAARRGTPRRRPWLRMRR